MKTVRKIEKKRGGAYFKKVFERDPEKSSTKKKKKHCDKIVMVGVDRY